MFNTTMKQSPGGSPTYQGAAHQPSMYSWYNQNNYQMGYGQVMMPYGGRQEDGQWQHGYNAPMDLLGPQHQNNNLAGAFHASQSAPGQNNIVPTVMCSPISNLGSDLSSGGGHSPSMCRPHEDSTVDDSPQRNGRTPYEWIKRNNHASQPQPGKHLNKFLLFRNTVNYNRLPHITMYF